MNVWKLLQVEYPSDGVITTTKSTNWQDSMITGNGTLGLLVPGGAARETFTVCHERLFLPFNEPHETPRFAEHVQTYRDLIENGEADRATNQMWEDSGLEHRVISDPFVPAFRLRIDTPEFGEETAYLRKTDYRTGVVTTCFSDDQGQRLQRDAFVSRADSVAVIRLSSTKPFAAEVSLDAPSEPTDELGVRHAQVVESADAEYTSDLLTWKTTYTNQWDDRPSGFSSAARLLTDGAPSADETCVRVEGATFVTILLSVSVAISPKRPDLSSAIDIVKSTTEDDAELLRRHVAIHQPLYDRVSLSLQTEQTPVETDQLIPTDNETGVSLRLIEQTFKASRYAIICSTGELPPNLQGLWTDTWKPPWSGDYTMNGNVNTAVAFGLNGCYPEVTLSLCNYIERFIEHYRVNARNVFGCNGLLLPGRASEAGYATHFSAYHPHNFWMAGTGWFARYFFDYWQYTQDETFLKERAIPFMLEAAEFYEEVVYYVDGKLRFCPSYSPENSPANQERSLSYNATMDVAAFKELLRDLISLGDRDEIPRDRLEKWKQLLADVPEYSVDETGAFKEWLAKDIPENQAHRHASQLYPLYHEVDPDIASSPELQEACKQTVEQRLIDRRKHNGGVMAFGLYQLAQASANLKDAVRVEECVNWMARSYWSAAFTCYHNPGKIFNTDICGGLPAAIIQMLVQSSLTEVELLPALPSSWTTGSIKGVCARGGIQLDIEWDDCRLVKASLCSNNTRTMSLRYGDACVDIELRKGEVVTVDSMLERV